jgi:plastocyanin
VRLALAAFGFLVGLVALAPARAQTGSVEGRVTIGVAGLDPGSLGELVVFLESEGRRSPPERAARRARIHQRDATFEPPFLVVVAGDTVEMPNDDLIFHNVFSYSKPNDFDLGVYPRGESRSVTFPHPGLVRIYCSIHESMSASIFVVPSPHWALARPDGSFAIRDVPPGRWRLRAWSWRLPTASAQVAVAPGRVARADLELGASGVLTGSTPRAPR